MYIKKIPGWRWMASEEEWKTGFFFIGGFGYEVHTWEDSCNGNTAFSLIDNCNKLKGLLEKGWEYSVHVGMKNEVMGFVYIYIYISMQITCHYCRMCECAAELQHATLYWTAFRERTIEKGLVTTTVISLCHKSFQMNLTMFSTRYTLLHTSVYICESWPILRYYSPC